jgi:iron complex transport system substrate-binding protein
VIFTKFEKIRPVPFFGLPALGIFLSLVLLLSCAAPDWPGHSRAEPQRIVSLIPAVTETLFAIGAGSKVVGVSAFDTWPPDVANIARVGGLIDPDTERILALRPDLAFVYGSQEDLIRQLRAAGIAVEIYRHGGLADVVSSIRTAGRRVGHEAQADRVAAEIERTITAIRDRTAALPRPSTLIVFGREEGTLRGIYASGGTGFIHDMVEAAGGRNVFGDAARESVQASLESILERAPEVILEIRASAVARDPGYAARQVAVWDAAPSIPAVRNKRVHVLLDERLVVPGPRIAAGVELLERALRR